MSLRFHEIAEGRNRILNPFSHEKLALLGEICQLEEGMRLLDLGCGKGEALTQWAQRHGIRGVGVDISEVFLQAARERAYEMDVGDKLNFVQGDAADYPESHHEFDVVMCLGVTWIGGGLLGTLELMRQALRPEGGLLVVGEPFWYEQPSAEALEALDVESDTFTSLVGTLDRFESAGLKLVEMLLARRDEFDRYESTQWMAVHEYLQQHPDDPEAAELQTWIRDNQRTYLKWGRDYMGWGVFVLHVPGDDPRV